MDLARSSGVVLLLGALEGCAAIALLAVLLGCGVTAGGITLSLLQDASLTLHTGGHNGAGEELNAQDDHPELP